MHVKGLSILFLASSYCGRHENFKERFQITLRRPFYLSKTLSEFGHRVTWITAELPQRGQIATKWGQKVISQNFQIRFIPTLFSSLFGRIPPVWDLSIVCFASFHFQLSKSLKNFELIFATDDLAWGILGLSASSILNSVPIVFDLLDYYPAYSWRKREIAESLQQFIIRKSDLVTCASRNLERYVRKLGYENAIHLPNGVDTERFHPIEMQYAKTVVNMPKNAKIVLYAGRLESDSGVDVLIKAFSRLIRRTRQKIFLVILGSGRKLEMYRSISYNLGIHKRVMFRNEVDSVYVPYYFNSANILIIPYLESPFTHFCFPSKLAEYMACKKPIVASNVGVLPSVVENGKDGFIYESQNAVELASKIDILLNDARLAESCATHAYYKAVENFTWRRLVTDFCDRIQELLEE